MTVTDRSVTSRTIAQHIESVTLHSASARTIRRRLQQTGLSARHPLLGLPLTQNHRRLRRQWCDERRICVMHRHTGPEPGIIVWVGIGYHSHTPLVRIDGTRQQPALNFRGVGASCSSLPSGLVHSHISTG
ncbi:transposable element Tcb1 transposase [Trichonephila clavipes]|nr:transposable element Tcb1 transposase [Trichonephila clavipes]